MLLLPFIVLDSEARETTDGVHLLFGTGDRLAGPVSLPERAVTYIGAFAEVLGARGTIE